MARWLITHSSAHESHRGEWGQVCAKQLQPEVSPFEACCLPGNVFFFPPLFSSSPFLLPAKAVQTLQRGSSSFTKRIEQPRFLLEHCVWRLFSHPHARPVCAWREGVGCWSREQESKRFLSPHAPF